MMNIKEEYIDKFFSILTKKGKNNIDFNSFFWHAFSFDKIPSIKGKLAIEKFNSKKINNVYVFFQQNDIIIEKQNLTYNQLLEIAKEVGCWDCYAVNKNSTWTFVITHETMNLDNIESDNFYIGPFYYNINMRKNN